MIQVINNVKEKDLAKEEKKKLKAESENEKKVIRFIFNEIINNKFLEFTRKEIRDGTGLSETKTRDTLTSLTTKGLVVERKRYENNTSFFTIEDLIRVCRNWCKKNKSKYI